MVNYFEEVTQQDLLLVLYTSPKFNVKTQNSLHHLKAIWTGNLQTQSNLKHFGAFQLLMWLLGNRAEPRAAWLQVLQYLSRFSYIQICLYEWQSQPDWSIRLRMEQFNVALRRIQRSELQKYVHQKHQKRQSITQ